MRPATARVRRLVARSAGIGVWTPQLPLTHGNDFTLSRTWSTNRRLGQAATTCWCWPTRSRRARAAVATVAVILDDLLVYSLSWPSSSPAWAICAPSCWSTWASPPCAARCRSIVLFELVFQVTPVPDARPVHHRHLLVRHVRPHLGHLQPQSVHLSAQLLSRPTRCSTRTGSTPSGTTSRASTGRCGRYRLDHGPPHGAVDGLVRPADDQVLQTGLMYQVFAYKLLMNARPAHQPGAGVVAARALMAGRPRARLTAFVVFAWNPLMLFDAAGNAHNDALMVTLLLLGVVPLVVARTRSRRIVGWLSGTFFVGMSALIKYTTGLVGLFYIVPWARRLADLACARPVDRRRGALVAAGDPDPVHPVVRLSARVRADAGRRGRQIVDVQQLGARPAGADHSDRVLDPSGADDPYDADARDRCASWVKSDHPRDLPRLSRLGAGPTVANRRRSVAPIGRADPGSIGARVRGADPGGADLGAGVVLDVAVGAGRPCSAGGAC